MRKFIVLAAIICIAALNVNAQTEEPESKAQKFFRLTKAADDNPKDWKAQLDAGHFLLDKDSGMYNQSQSEKYFERIYHQATDYNKEVPDSVLREALTMLRTLASDKKDLDKALFYIDEYFHAYKVGVEISDEYLCSVAFMGMLYSMIKENMAKALMYMTDIRDRVTKNKMSGIEHTDVTTSILYEHIVNQYKESFGDKLIEVTLDGKNYVMIAKDGWNVERPLLGWMGKTDGDDDAPTLFLGEDGKTYDDIHGDMVYSFFFNKEGIKPQDGTNMRMITVTPERRQQLAEAYHKYMKKSKKSKK